MIRIVRNGRLVYYREAAGRRFWDRHWNESIRPEHYTGAMSGDLDLFEDVFTRYLPRQGRILEAGCGTGRYVLALRKHGYSVEGIDSAAKTIRKVRALHPTLPVRVGDVLRIKVPHGHYAAYVSLGVMEHFPEGPEACLREAWRVLSPEGIALISVPWFNPLRIAKSKIHFGRHVPPGLNFYQYAFRAGEFSDILAGVGFEEIEKIGYDPLKGLRDEIPFLRRLSGWGRHGLAVQRGLQILTEYPFMRRRVAHMLLFVLRKPGPTS